jgi:hypothetical protein
MATQAERVQELLIERLETYYSGRTVAPGTSLYDTVVTPVAAYLGVDATDTDIAEFLKTRLRQEYPSVSAENGDAIVDLLINPLSLLLEALKRETALIKLGQSVQTAVSMRESDADALAANFFVTRRVGNKAYGLVRIYYANPTSVFIGVNTRFTNSAGLVFQPITTQSFSAEQLLLQRSGNYYYIDVSLVSAEPGAQYNIAPNTITNVTGLTGYVKFTNLAAFAAASDRETNLELLTRVRSALTERSLNTRRGIVSRVQGQFPSIRSVEVVGYGDPEMQRDIVTGSSEGHVVASGTCFIVGQFCLMLSQFEDRGRDGAAAIKAGDTIALNYWNLLYSLPQASRNEEFKIADIVFDTRDTLPDIPSILLFRLSAAPSPESSTLGMLPAMLPGVFCVVRSNTKITISGIPGGIQDPQTPAGELEIFDNEVHIGGHYDVWLRPSVDQATTATFGQMLSNSSVSDGRQLATAGGEDTGRNVVTIPYSVSFKDGFSSTSVIFTPGNLVIGSRSGATATVATASIIRATGSVTLTAVTGAFEVGEEITNTAATAGGTITYVSSDLETLGARAGMTLVLLTGADVGSYRILDVVGESIYLDTDLTESETQIHFRVLSEITEDLFAPKVVIVPFADALGDDLSTVVGSSRLRLKIDLQQYGAVVGDSIEIFDGNDAGVYTIQSFDTVLGGIAPIVSSAMSASNAKLTYRVYRASTGVQRPLVRIKPEGVRLLDSAGKDANIVVPYALPLGAYALGDFSGAKEGLTGRNGFVLPDPGTAWTPTADLTASRDEFADALACYSDECIPCDGYIAVVTLMANGQFYLNSNMPTAVKEFFRNMQNWLLNVVDQFNIGPDAKAFIHGLTPITFGSPVDAIEFSSVVSFDSAAVTVSALGVATSWTTNFANKGVRAGMQVTFPATSSNAGTYVIATVVGGVLTFTTAPTSGWSVENVDVQITTSASGTLRAGETLTIGAVSATISDIEQELVVASTVGFKDGETITQGSMTASIRVTSLTTLALTSIAGPAADAFEVGTAVTGGTTGTAATPTEIRGRFVVAGMTGGSLATGDAVTSSSTGITAEITILVVPVAQFEICLPGEMFDGCNNVFIALPEFDWEALLATTDTFAEAISKYTTGQLLGPPPALATAKPGDVVSLLAGANEGQYSVHSVKNYKVGTAGAIVSGTADFTKFYPVTAVVIDGEFPVAAFGDLASFFADGIPDLAALPVPNDFPGIAYDETGMITSPWDWIGQFLTWLFRFLDSMGFDLPESFTIDPAETIKTLWQMLFTEYRVGRRTAEQTIRLYFQEPTSVSVYGPRPCRRFIYDDPTYAPAVITTTYTAAGPATGAIITAEYTALGGIAPAGLDLLVEVHTDIVGSSFTGVSGTYSSLSTELNDSAANVALFIQSQVSPAASFVQITGSNTAGTITFESVATGSDVQLLLSVNDLAGVVFPADMETVSTGTSPPTGTLTVAVISRYANNLGTFTAVADELTKPADELAALIQAAVDPTGLFVTVSADTPTNEITFASVERGQDVLLLLSCGDFADVGVFSSDTETSAVGTTTSGPVVAQIYEPHLPTLFSVPMGAEQLLFTASADAVPARLFPSEQEVAGDDPPLLPRDCRVPSVYTGATALTLTFTEQDGESWFYRGLEQGDLFQLFEQKVMLKPTMDPTPGGAFERFPALITTAGSASVRLPALYSAEFTFLTPSRWMDEDTFDVFDVVQVGDLLYIEEGDDTGVYRISSRVSASELVLDRPLTTSSGTVYFSGNRSEIASITYPATTTDKVVVCSVGGTLNSTYVGKYLTIWGSNYAETDGSYEITAIAATGSGDSAGYEITLADAAFSNPEMGLHWAIVRAPNTAPADSALGGKTELVGVRPFRIYSGRAKEWPVVAVERTLDATACSVLISIAEEITSSGAPDPTEPLPRAPRVGFRQPYGFVRNSAQHISSTAMMTQREGTLYYFDVVAHSLDSRDLNNISKGTRLEPVFGTYDSDGYYLTVGDTNYTFSPLEQTQITLTPRMLPAGRDDLAENLLLLAGRRIAIQYQTAPAVAQVQDLLNSQADRVLCANPLARHFLPSYVSFTVSPSVVDEDAQLIATKISEYIEGLSSAQYVELSKIEGVMQGGGVTNYPHPLYMYAVAHDLDRRLVLTKSESRIGDVINHNGTNKITYYIPGPAGTEGLAGAGEAITVLTTGAATATLQ